MRKLIGLICAAALLLAFCGCAQQTRQRGAEALQSTEASAAQSNSTLTGKVLSIDGTVVTLELGELAEVQAPGGQGGEKPPGMPGAQTANSDTPLEMPEGGMGSSGGSGGSTPPEMPGSEAPEEQAASGDTPPEMPEGGMGSSGGSGGSTTSETPGSEAPEEQAASGDTPSEMPEGGMGSSGGSGGNTPPETPTGEGETPPEKPDGDMAADDQGMQPAMGGMPGASFTAGDETVTIDLAGAAMTGDSAKASLDEIAANDILVVEMGGGNTAVSVTVKAMNAGMMGGPGGQMGGVESYDAANEYTADASAENTELVSTGTDENAIHVYAGATVSLDGVTVTRDSGDSTGGDASSFYGVGAAALVTDGTLSISGSAIESDAAGGAGVFAYGGGTAYVSDTTIRTRQDTSGGVHVAGGGTLYAWELDVETEGESAAAIRSDRGSGTMVVDGGTYTSNGVGSPAVYSTADITINDAVLTATGSEAICIEGLNAIRLFDCDLSGNMSDLSQNDCTWNVILYQSMSGDSEVGNSTFEMVGGTLKAGNGGMFYTTNTESTFILSDVDITYAADSAFFLKCTGNSNQRGWGSAGANGADCSFTAIAQEMQGDVIWDSISRLDMYMMDGSTLTGRFVNDESNAGNGGGGYARLCIDETGTWIVTGDSTLTELCCAGTIVDAEGNAVSIVGTDGTVYAKGDSAHTVTVESYSDSADLSGASSAEAWTDYAVEKK